MAMREKFGQCNFYQGKMKFRSRTERCDIMKESAFKSAMMLILFVTYLLTFFTLLWNGEGIRCFILLFSGIVVFPIIYFILNYILGD